MSKKLPIGCGMHRARNRNRRPRKLVLRKATIKQETRP